METIAYIPETNIKNTECISIILPCYNEEKYIGHCLASVIHSDYPKEFLELIIVDGGSSDNTRGIIKEYMLQYPFIKLLSNPQKIVPISMNMGIKAATGNYIIRIDAHSCYASNYFSKLIEWHKKLKADNVGGIARTEVLHLTEKSKAIKEVLGNKFGVGNSIFRLGIDSVQEVDTVPFGCYHKNVFQKYGYYNEQLIRNQDIEFNKRIKKQGGKIYLIPEISCTYYARETWSKLAKNNYQNGLWNLLTLYYTYSFSSLSLRHLVPFFFVLSLIVPIIAGIFSPPFFLIAVVSLASYLIAVTVIALQIAANKKMSFLYLLGSFITLHFSYGCGSSAGLFKVIQLKLTRTINSCKETTKLFIVNYPALVKRIFDLILAVVALVVLIPLLFIVALLIKITTPDGPVIFKQKRIGRYGKPFMIYKFRTMYTGHSHSSATVSGQNRITPLGAFLRKYKIDELPELIHIINGTMSFVGPRPDVPGYADKLTGENRKILELRPGLTGPASLKYVNEEFLLARVPNPEEYNDTVIYPDKVRINLNYYYHRSLWLDVKIIIYTFLGKKLSDKRFS